MAGGAAKESTPAGELLTTGVQDSEEETRDPRLPTGTPVEAPEPKVVAS